MSSNLTTTSPPPGISCPFLTDGGYSETTDQYYCDYTAWAFGILALGSLLIIVVPLLLLICCIMRRRTKRRLRRLTSSSSYASHGGYPYQPLRQDDGQPIYQSYGAVESNNRHDSSRCTSPGHDSAGEQSTQQQDTSSIASSKASLAPNYDEASLNFRNAAIANRARMPTPNSFQQSREHLADPNAGENNHNQLVKQGSNVNSNLTLNVVADSIGPVKQSCTRDDPNSPIYPVLEVDIPEDCSTQYKPRESKGPENRKDRGDMEVITETPVYAVLEGPGNNDISLPGNASGTTVKSDIDAESDGTSHVTHPGKEAVYAVLEEPASEQCPSEQMEALPENSPVYQTLEPLIPEMPGKENLPDSLQETVADHESGQDVVPDDNKITTEPTPQGVISNLKLLAQNNDEREDISGELAGVEERYMPLLPPKARSHSDKDDSEATTEPFTNSTESDDGLPQEESRKRLKSRADYEECLLDMVRSLPANEKNGSYLLRDSVTAPDSKVLTLYCKQPDSGQELYNFKVCFTEDGQAYLSKSKKRFSSTQDLLDFLKENKDMLPCILRRAISPETDSGDIS